MLTTSSVRHFIIISFEMESSIPAKTRAASIFSILSQSLFIEFQIKGLIMSIEKIEAVESLLYVGLWCENASKHTFKKRIIGVFSEFSIQKIETKKGVCAWSFALLGPGKEQILSFGIEGDLKGAAGAFQKHRAVPPVLAVQSVVKKRKKKASANKDTNRETLNKEALHLSAVRLIRRFYVFLFSYSPKLFYQKLLRLIAFLWLCLLVGSVLILMAFILNHIVQHFGLNLEIPPEVAKKLNALLVHLKLPPIFPVPEPAPASWYHPGAVCSFFRELLLRSFSSFFVEITKRGFHFLWECLWRKPR